MEDYFLGVHQKEVERLHRQHLAWQPATRQLIQTAKLPSCKNILDIGCGPGFTTFELATACPASQITALDKATLYQEYLNSKIAQNKTQNISTLQADLLDLPQQAGLYEGAFCRWVLAFLIADLPAVLSSIYKKLAPGGVFAAMEYLTLDSFTTSPPNTSFDAHTKAWNAFYLNHGGDARIGTYLPQLLTEAGFVIESNTCVGGMAPVQHRWWHWWKDAFHDFAPTFVEQGLLSQADFDGLAAYWKQQATMENSFIYTAVISQIVARKS